MQIRNIRLSRFGACSDLSLDALTDGVNVIHGPAGSGKATLGRFVRSVLYGFDDSTRRQYLPVESQGFGGSIKIRTLSGNQTITRVDDGTHDGQLRIEGEGGVAIQRQHLSEIAAVPESTFDRIYAVDYRRRPGIGALIEEAHVSGFDLLGRDIDADQLSVLEQELRRQRDSLATVPRVQATHDELVSRRAELVRVIGELERALADQADEAVLTAQINRLESQLGQWQADLNKVQHELEVAESRRRHILASRNAEPTKLYSTAPLVQEYSELKAQIERWQSTLREVTARRQLLEERSERHSYRELPGKPRECLNDIEAQLDDLQSSLAEIKGSVSYEGREIHGLFTDTFAELRANVYRLCNQLNYWESTAIHRSLSGESSDLIRCEAELRLAIKGATSRKEALQREIEDTFGENCVALADWHGELCECAQHPPIKASHLVSEARTDWEHELSIVSAEIATLERRQERLVADVNDIESDLADVRAQLRHLDQVELLDQLDAKRAELRRTDQNLRDADKRRELLAQIADTEQQIAELRANSRTSALVADASEYLRRLTAGDLRKIEVAANEQVWIVDEHGRRRAYHQLSDGGRDLVYLSICLTLVDGFKARGIHVPMIVSGAFTHVDSKNVPEAAELVRDFSARGHQILLFTRHEHVASVFRLLNVPVRTLDQVVLPSAKLAGTTLTQIDDTPFDDYDDVTTNVYTLSEHQPIEEAPAIDATNAAKLRKIGVMRVGDLLRLSAKSGAAELQEYGITVDQIVSWKAQTRLLCEVPRLRGYDARILVACGITEPEQLYRLSPSELRKIVKDMAASSNGQTLLLSGTEFELSRVADWIGTRGEHSRSRNSRSHHDSERNPRRGERSSRERTSNGRSSNERDPDVVKMRTSDSEWKFYLGRNDSVVDAPSIGARTAERLEAIGIETVSDLLNANPEFVSSQLEVKRFTADVVTQWQQQTELACRVPQLRGHDAQILVALGVTDVETLAASEPHELWTLVEPFVETKEGKRIIRNGKTPDLEEVTEWVQWAQASRQLSAA